MASKKSGELITQWRRWAARRAYTSPASLVQKTPLDVRIMGRMLLHAAIVGVSAGLCGAAFIAASVLVESIFLEYLAGYDSLRAHGESVQRLVDLPRGTLRPWLLLLVPAFGGLVSGLICMLAPETQGGGGGNAMIRAFHRSASQVRPRVILVRFASAIACLGCGGSGGREGPTMQIGGGIGSVVANALRMSARERRVLYIAGVAAGMSAVFRTPLGAALLAVEILYRDDFEAEALIPAILSSVVAYSTVVALTGDGASLFGTIARFRFVPLHLPYYIALAAVVSAGAMFFLAALRAAHRLGDRLKVPMWAKPGVGGAVLGLVATSAVTVMMLTFDLPVGQGLGLLGSGYGEIQLALTGADWLPVGWQGMAILVALFFAKMLATCATLGTGGSAGDFAPSMVLGGLIGGAVGRALQLLTHDPTLDAGAFVLVGMATFYGGIAHAPLSSLVMACEMAGSYDLLVPLMMAEGVAFVLLRNQSLYSAQLASQKDSPVHRELVFSEALSRVAIRDILAQPYPPLAVFTSRTPARQMLETAAVHREQVIFPVVDDARKLLGVVSADTLGLLAVEAEDVDHLIAADVLQPSTTALLDDTLQHVCNGLIDAGARAAVVLDEQGTMLGVLDEMSIARVHLNAPVRP